MKHYYWEEPILYKHCTKQIIRRCVPKDEVADILRNYHTLECGGHYGGQRTAVKILQSRFYWATLFKDTHSFVSACDTCQRSKNIARRNEMPLHGILEMDGE